jgi:tRNA (mo5U34)-methyltransferase
VESKQTDQVARLRDEIIRLGPWHLDVEVTAEISTRAFLDAPEGTYSRSGPLDPSRVSFISPRNEWERLMKCIYPNGLNGKTLLDCACNCGGYSFWAKELGAEGCFGFDVREHWIRQARFLADHRQWSTEGLRFEVLDLYDLPKQGLKPFDIALFKGIFYHLPDPINGIKLVGDLTRELFILDTAIRMDLSDGMLVLATESPDTVMSGVYGLNWFPTGHHVLLRLLRWLGFPEARVVSWQREPGREPFGRLQIVAARDAGLLQQLSSVERPGDVEKGGPGEGNAGERSPGPVAEPGGEN